MTTDVFMDQMIKAGRIKVTFDLGHSIYTTVAKVHKIRAIQPDFTEYFRQGNKFVSLPQFEIDLVGIETVVRSNPGE